MFSTYIKKLMNIYNILVSYIMVIQENIIREKNVYDL